METISFKIQEEILTKMDGLIKPMNFNNRTEFIREAIREKLNQAEKEQLIKKLTEFKGSLKGKSKMSDEEARRLASLKIAKKFGIKLD